MSKVAVQENITAQLQGIPNGPGKFLAVYEGSMSDEKMAELAGTGTEMEPFIVVSYTGFAKAPNRFGHVTGVKDNSAELQIVINAIATTDNITHRVLEQVTDRLVGYEPPNAGEIVYALFHSVGAVSFLGSPTRYSAVQSLTTLVNAD